jgi:membrane associated rhomboid family serine protease
LKRGAVGAAAVPPREPSPRSITLAIRPSQMPANAPTSARPAASVPTAAAVARPAPVVPEIRIAPEVRRPAKIDPVRPPADYGRSQYATTGSKGHDEPSIGEYLAGVLGLPVEDRNARDSEVAKTRPWGTYALAAILVAVAYFGRNSVERMIEMWGFVPAQWHRLGLFTAATCFFIHAGFIHVLGNVYFLATFGDDVEDHLGRSRFLWLVAVAHLVGIIAHGWFDARPDVPLVGASAGISGVIAFYAVSFPRARLRLFAIVTWVRLGAFKAFMLWVGLQAVMAVAQAGGLTSVSAYAHLGGAAVGMLGGALLQKQRRDAFRPDERKLDSGRPERHAIEQRRVYVPSAGYLSTPAQVRSVWHEYLDSKRPT